MLPLSFPLNESGVHQALSSCADPATREMQKSKDPKIVLPPSLLHSTLLRSKARNQTAAGCGASETACAVREGE
ncbi:hypothetical protein NDU88_006184 [Pleurodeles waltl]|uniref:Uncharacterized protein n=1 Tax=Pleurodeles waltl TaxID=8319 RepID=A0AAV7PHL3_PLEWA|nr:hypothetical protein NDU88_006184 [Pleurodeles waltl]